MYVRDWMTTPAITIAAQTTLDVAMRMMRSKKIRRLPVVDDDLRLVGIVSRGDLQRGAPSQLGTMDIWELTDRLGSMTVELVMSHRVRSCGPDTPIEEAARIMVENKIRGLPVVEAESVVGVVTETDVFKAFLELFAGDHPGLRLALDVPDRPGILAELTQSIGGLNGRLLSAGTFPSREAGRRRVVMKVDGVERDRVLWVLNAQGVKLLDP